MNTCASKYSQIFSTFFSSNCSKSIIMTSSLKQSSSKLGESRSKNSWKIFENKFVCMFLPWLQTAQSRLEGLWGFFLQIFSIDYKGYPGVCVLFYSISLNNQKCEIIIFTSFYPPTSPFLCALRIFTKTKNIKQSTEFLNYSSFYTW